MNKNVAEEIKSAKSAEELKAVAEKHGVRLDEDKVKDAFAAVQRIGELSDEEIDAAGGGCMIAGELLECPNCKTQGTLEGTLSDDGKTVTYKCKKCTHTFTIESIELG